MLTEEQAAQIKSQLLQQIQNFPEDKKAAAEQQIEEMNSEQLEAFLEQNNLVKSDGNQQGDQQGDQQCVFCSIISGNISSHQVDENSKAIAVLEINPISKGHTIIIPREHNILDKNKTSKEISSLIKKVETKIKKLKPKDILTSETNLFGHTVINLIPVYTDETPESERQKASQEDLEETLRELLKEKEIIKETKPTKLKEKKLWIPRRTP